MKKGWDVKPLGEVCDIIGGGTPSKNINGYYDGDIPWATVRDMNVDIVQTTVHSITKEGLENSSSKLIAKGEIIIASRVGLGKVCKLGENMAINQDLKGIVPKPAQKISRQFLFYWFKSVASQIEKNGAGATVKGVKLAFLNQLEFPIPPLEEQERIVAILDQAFEGLDRAKENAEANLQSAKELFDRSAAKAFEELAANDNARTFLVEELALPQKGSIRTGPFGSQLKHSEFVDKGISVLGIDNAVKNEFQWGKARFITEEKYQGLERYTVKPRDVIITIMGTCGRCAIIPEDIPTAINTKHLCCISLDQSKCLPEFLHRYFLHSPQGREYLLSQASGSVMDGLNMGIIKSMPVEVPPLERQKKIADKLNEIAEESERLSEYYQSKLSDLDDLRQSLLQKAFSGELT